MKEMIFGMEHITYQWWHPDHVNWRNDEDLKLFPIQCHAVVATKAQVREALSQLTYGHIMMFSDVSTDPVIRKTAVLYGSQGNDSPTMEGLDNGDWIVSIPMRRILTVYNDDTWTYMRLASKDAKARQLTLAEYTVQGSQGVAEHQLFLRRKGL